MRLKELATKFNLSLENLQNFIHDFGIDLNFCFNDKLEVSTDFQNYVSTHIAFITKYAEDKKLTKNIATIASTINLPIEKVEEFFIQNGVEKEIIKDFQTNISSYLIHIFLGGNYDFLDKEIPEKTYHTNTLIGYSDLFFYTTDMLEPFINEDQVKLWGIEKPSGIILHGPPGSGKIFWAKRIANLIGYEFIHVYNDYILKTNAKQFSDYLKQKMNQPKTLLFIENFDELMSKNGDSKNSPQAIEVINTIIRQIQKDNNKELILVGSAEIISLISEEITAPGRFDIQIPVFPPNVEERAKLIRFHLTNNLVEQSPLLNLLLENKATEIEFWEPIANEMKLFSNTMIIDFTQTLKKRLYTLFRKDENKKIEINEQLIMACYTEAKSKLTPDYLKRVQIFLLEAKQNVELDFPQRFFELQFEIDSLTDNKEVIRKIGF